MDDPGKGRNLTMVPTVTNVGGEKYDTVRYNVPYDQNEWTKVMAMVTMLVMMVMMVMVVPTE